MKFILKDNHIYIVENSGFAYNNIEGEVILDFVPQKDGVKLLYSINDAPFKDLKERKIKVETSELGTPDFLLKIKVVSKDGVDLYTSDKVALTYAVILGQKMENAYPEIIKSLLQSVKRLEGEQEALTKHFKEQLRNILDVVDAINKKGNLF